MERKDGGRPGAMESATAVRAQRHGRDATVERKVRAEIFVFLAKCVMGVTVRMIVMVRSGRNRGPPTQGSERTDALPATFQFLKKKITSILAMHSNSYVSIINL
jgi:hypothetical protein